MALSSKGMLVIFTDIPAAEEDEFNRWYDREHTEERVAIPGFVRARRWVIESGDAPKYLALYETETFDVLSSPPYKAALAAQTDWSKAVMARFVNVKRSVARITRAAGLGSGGVVATIRLRPDEGAEDALRERVSEGLSAILDAPGIVSAFLLESDPDLSKPLPEQKAALHDDSNRDWLICVEATGQEAARDALAAKLTDAELAAPGAKVLARAAYRLMWGLTRRELADEGRLTS